MKNFTYNYPILRNVYLNNYGYCTLQLLRHLNYTASIKNKTKIQL